MRVLIIGNGVVGRATAMAIQSVEQSCVIDMADLEDKSAAFSKHTYDHAFICVPTPAGEHTYDYSSVLESLRYPAVQAAKAVCLRSTVGPDIFQQQEEVSKRIDVHFPEFLRERSYLKDVLFPDIAVIGTRDGKPDPIFSYFPAPRDGIIWTSREEAALLKMVHNAMASLRIAAMNEIYLKCKDTAYISWKTFENNVKRLLDSRGMGTAYLSVPGYDGKPGFGGKCFPKDLDAFIKWLSVSSVFSGAKKLNDMLRKEGNG